MTLDERLDRDFGAFLGSHVLLKSHDALGLGEDVIGLLLAAAGGQREDHDQRQKQSKNLFHVFILLIS